MKYSGAWYAILWACNISAEVLQFQHSELPFCEFDKTLSRALFSESVL